ncbi:MAG: GGDEF domain-containing protein [Minisyncoccia bacterium]
MSFSSSERPRALTPKEKALVEKNRALEAEVRVAGVENWGRQEEQKGLEEKIGDLEERIGIDPLTGARQRDVLFAELDQMLKRIHEPTGEHRKEGVSVIFIDLDNFKKVNDKFGHGTGDKVLIKVAGLLKGPLRDSDILARYGGDEFVVLLPNTNEEHALVVAEKLRTVFEDQDLSVLGVTASIGLCSSDLSSAADSKTFIDNADKAAYAAKDSGKNAVRVYHGS